MSKVSIKSKATPVSEVPEKLYFKIGEVAKIVGVEPYVLRYWEKEFPDIAPGKSRSKQRLYKRKEVLQILEIRKLLYDEKFTIHGARNQLKLLHKKNGPSDLEQQIQLPLQSEKNLQKILQKIQIKLQDLAEILN